MTQTRYKITMDGSLAPGFSLKHAQENFARLFKTEVSAVKRLFHSGTTVIKRDISSAQADQYIQALLSNGVVAQKELDLAAGLSMEPIATDPQQPAAGHMQCPKCATEQRENDICQSCGIVIAKFNRYQAAPIQQTGQVSPAPASPYATPKATLEQTNDEVAELSYWGVEGRLGRMRFIAWSLVLMLAMAPAMLIAALAIQMSTLLGGILIAGITLVTIVIAIQFSVKRLHDIGWSGWLLLITLIPVIGSLFQLLIFVLPGSQNSNRYGAAPPENSTAVKVLFWLWLLFIVIGVGLSMLGGALAALLSL